MRGAEPALVHDSGSAGGIAKRDGLGCANLIAGATLQAAHIAVQGDFGNAVANPPQGHDTYPGAVAASRA